MDKNTKFLGLIASTSPDGIRMETLLGVEFLVVPVVAMKGDAVIWPVNSPHPQLCPASELEKLPAAWDGSPLVPNHPFDADGNALSANTPEIEETMAFGKIFNSSFDGDLKLEAWINTERARTLGGDALRVLERCEARERIEISVGNYAQAEPTPGVKNGKPYFSIWRNIVPDHLAMLPEGSVGACSNDMGCGAPRVNKEGGSTMSPKLLQLIAAATKWFEAEDSEPVVAKEKETDTSTEDDATLVTSECKCRKTEDKVVETDATATEEGGLTVSEKVKTLAARLIGLEKSPFTSECEATLLNFSEAQLENLVEQYEEPEPVKEKEAEEVAKTEPVTSKATEEEGGDEDDSVKVSQEVYDRLVSAAATLEASENAEKNRLIALIEGKSKLFSNEELKAKTNDELTKLVTLVGVEPTLVPSLSQTDSTNEDSGVPEVPSLKAAIDARRQGK